jgi:hypothetical protein
MADETDALFDTVTGVELARRTFNFTNIGDAPTSALTVELRGDVGHFDVEWDGCNGMPLAAHATCQVVARLLAVSDGSFDGELHVFGDALQSASVLLRGKVMPASLSLTPATSPTIDVVQGQSYALVFIARNDGGVATGPLRFTGPGAPFNGRSANCDGVSLVGGATCMVTLADVVAVDAPLGNASSSLEVAAAPGGTASVAPAIVVHAGGVLEVENKGWGTIPTVKSVENVVHVRNPGPQTTQALTTTISTTESFTSFFIASDGCRGKTLAPGQSCDVTVMANVPDEQLHTATLQVEAPNVRAGKGLLAATGMRAHWTVSLSFAGNGNGRISWTGGGSIGSPATARLLVANGTASPTFTVVADPPATFTGWSGTAGCSGTGPCAPFVGSNNSDLTLVATLTQ